MERNKDEDSLISAVYTESGNNLQNNNHAAFQGVEEDEEAFRRELETERARVMKEFGIIVPTNIELKQDDVMSIADESLGGDSIFAESYNGILQQLDKSASNHKTSSTPETYDNVYGENDDESNSFRPNALFGSPKEEEDAKAPAGTYRERLTPGRLGIAILVLSIILVTAVAVAVGSFLAQDDELPLQSGAEFPDLGTIITSPPTASPTKSFEWTEGNCTDHPYKRFNINEEVGDQNCVFLQGNSTHRDRMCLPENDGYRWCPATCGVCEQVTPSSDYPSDIPSMAPSERVEERPVATPTRHPAADPTRRPVLERPVADPTQRPVADPTQRPVVERPVAENPTRRPVAEMPVPNPTRRPVATVPPPTRRPVAERPVADPTRRPVAERPVSPPTPRPVAERPVTRPTPRPVPDPTRRPVVESPVADPTPRPVPPPTPRPVAAPVPSPVVDPAPVPVPVLTNVPVASPPTEATPPPVDDDDGNVDDDDNDDDGGGEDPPPFLCRVCILNICELLPC